LPTQAKPDVGGGDPPKATGRFLATVPNSAAFGTFAAKSTRKKNIVS